MRVKEEPIRWRSVLFAAFRGTISAFALSHNPLYHTLLVFMAPFALVAGPFVGGLNARNYCRLGFRGTLVVALGVAIGNYLPLGLAIPLVFSLRGLFPDEMTANGVIQAMSFIWLGLFCYSFLGAIAGVWYKSRKLAEEAAALARAAAADSSSYEPALNPTTLPSASAM